MKKVLSSCVASILATLILVSVESPVFAKDQQAPCSEKTQTSRQKAAAYLKLHDVQIVKVNNSIRLIVPSDMIFRPVSTERIEDSRDLLKQLADYVSTYDAIKVEVAGYMDTSSISLVYYPQGIDQLTKDQAQQVANALWSKGTQTRIIYAKGFGSDDPVADNKSSLGAYLNRRIEIRFNYIDPNLV